MAGLAVTIIPEDCVNGALRILPDGENGYPLLPDFKTFLFGASPSHPASVKAFAEMLRVVVGGS